MASLGGLLKVGLGVASKFIPGVAQIAGAYTAGQAIHRTLKGGQTGGTLPALGGILNAGPRINLPGAMDRRGDRGILGFGGLKTRRKYRRMNPMNVKAARRAIRRIYAGEKLMRSIFSITRQKDGVRPKRPRKRA